MSPSRHLNPYSAWRSGSSLRTLSGLARCFKLSHLFTIQHPLVSASRERGEKFNIQNLGTAPSTPSFLNPLTPRYCVVAFTLIELMAATTVLSVILLMMIGMQDQMSKAWSNANRRTDATREARAACRLMARDFSYFLIRPTNVSRNMMRAPAVTNSMVPFYYYSGTGSITTALSMPAEVAPGSSYIFGIVPRKKSSANDSDFALAGYYIAWDTNTNVNGFLVTNWNLHRYYKTSTTAVAALSNWITAPNPNPNNLFPAITTTNTQLSTGDEILARNACNLQIKVYGSTNSSNGLISNYTYGTSSANGIYTGNKIHVELTFYPEDNAQKLPNLQAWTNTNNLQKLARTFEFNVDLPENEN
jgi:hypothetical protein